MSTHAIPVRPEFAGILRTEQSYAVSGKESLGNRVNGGFDRLIVQSGSEMAPAMVLAVCLCSAIAFGGLGFVLQENLLAVALGAALGAVLPIVVLVVNRTRRQQAMLRQFPAMLDELARAARTGRSLEHCLELVAGDTPLPLGRELQRCTHKIKLGMPIADALAELPSRTGLVATNVFVSALSVHRDTGGDLVRVLERLARTLRSRIEFSGRVRTATAASRATAILMIAIPPAVIAFFLFRDPTYFDTLTASTWGRGTLIAAAVLQVIGIVWVLQVLKRTNRG